MPPSSELLHQINSYLETCKPTVPIIKDTPTQVPHLQDLKVNDTPDFAKTFLDIGGPHVLEKKANKQQNKTQDASPPS